MQMARVHILALITYSEKKLSSDVPIFEAVAGISNKYSVFVQAKRKKE